MQNSSITLEGLAAQLKSGPLPRFGSQFMGRLARWCVPFATATMLLLYASVSQAADGDRDPTFNPGGSGADAGISAVAVQPDGKIIIGGGFNSYNGNSAVSHFVMRLNADGTPDQTFNPGGAGPNSGVGAIAIQSDGKILIGGAFTSYNGDANASDKIMRLNADGTRDPTFNAGGIGADNNVFAVAVQADGKILIGGFFRAYNGDSAASDCVMRLNSDGTRDASFNPGGAGANFGVYAIAIQPDAKILIGGFVTSYNGDDAASDCIMRLNSDGTRDTGFNPGGSGLNNRAIAIALQADGKILIGGDFFIYNGDGAPPDNIMRLNADGTRDLSFNGGGAGADSPIYSVVVQSNGKILIGGGRTYNGDASANDWIMRLKGDGTLDRSFNPGGTGANSPVNAVALQADGKVLIAGDFTSYNGDSTAPDRIMRLLAETAPSSFSFSQSNYFVGESDRSLTITVNRVGDTSFATTVEYSTTNGSADCNNPSHLASAKCDFTAALGTLRFAAGEVSKTFDVLITQDSLTEGPETFGIALSNPSDGALLGANANVTINDDPNEPGGNAIDDPVNFVRQHYHDFLNREPDQAGLDFWTNQITSCGSDAGCTEARRIDVSASFFLSIEFQQTGYFVERLFKTAYGDAPGNSTFPAAHTLPVPVIRLNEFLTDTQRIGRGVVVLQPGWEQALENNKQAYIQEFLQTARFQSAFSVAMRPDQFVDKLNQNAGNVLSSSERATAIALFGNSGNTTDVTARGRALRQVAEDPDLVAGEFNRAFVLMQYFGYLRRNPNDPQDSDYTGYDFWLTKLNQFNGNYTNAEMVKAFLSSIEYRQRFGP
jgi:uncharacterized delta-60 repeat protein